MRIMRSILLVLVGISSIVYGVNCYNAGVGETVSYKEYGGDAFTDIQNAEAQTGGLIRLQSSLQKDWVGTAFIFAGLTMIVCAIPTNLKKKED